MSWATSAGRLLTARIAPFWSFAAKLLAVGQAKGFEVGLTAHRQHLKPVTRGVRGCGNVVLRLGRPSTLNKLQIPVGKRRQPWYIHRPPRIEDGHINEFNWNLRYVTASESARRRHPGRQTKRAQAL